MKIYNSLTNEIEAFEPKSDPVSLYVCGITPYDTTHLGHAFTYSVSDILIRYLESSGLTVRYVQNVTDIDDDILKKAKEVGEDWKEVGDRWTSYFIRDMKALNVRPPDFFPRATDVIPEIIQRVQKLVEQGVAYVERGNVYFDINAWQEFGKLSQLSREEMLPIANQRGNNPDDPNKRDPLDFVLWQARSSDEPFWESPWGLGRPGWHIECSTMCNYYLGDVVDIHSGGEDLCFPHHEAEIAQVEPVTDKKPFVRFWMHVAMVRHEGEKMSKSLGNLVMVRDLLKEYSPDAIRFYLGGYHYRHSWSFDQQALDQAEQSVNRLREAASIRSGEKESLDPSVAWVHFTQSMENDLDTPAAQKVLVGLADKVLEAAQKGQDVTESQKELRKMSAVFGLRLDHDEPEPRVVMGWDEHLKRFLGKEELSV